MAGPTKVLQPLKLGAQTVRGISKSQSASWGCLVLGTGLAQLAACRDADLAAMTCLADDLEASLAHLRVPARHRINVRTTNLLERSFGEERRRTKVIPRLLDERSAMKLVFATLIRVSDRWQRLPVSDLDRQQLRLLRRELGIDPDPNERKEMPKRKRSAA